MCEKRGLVAGVGSEGVLVSQDEKRGEGVGSEVNVRNVKAASAVLLMSQGFTREALFGLERVSRISPFWSHLVGQHGSTRDYE